MDALKEFLDQKKVFILFFGLIYAHKSHSLILLAFSLLIFFCFLQEGLKILWFLGNKNISFLESDQFMQETRFDFELYKRGLKFLF